MVGTTTWNAKSLRSCGTYRQLRSDATTLAFALGNAWKIDGPGMSSSNIGDLWHSRTPRSSHGRRGGYHLAALPGTWGCHESEISIPSTALARKR